MPDRADDPRWVHRAAHTIDALNQRLLNQRESIGRLLVMAGNQDPDVGPELERLHERLAAYMQRWEMAKEASPAVAALVAEMMPDPYPEQP